MSTAPVDALFSSCVVLSDFALLILLQPLYYAVGCPLPVGYIPRVAASLRRDRTEARGEGGIAPLSPRCRAVAAGRRDGGQAASA